ncbi:MAG: oligosaccharide flippase family protein [Faecalibacterium sp.]|nr:oligosaccharide flippase family protein [Faecalibacterium sp.]
MYKRSVKKSVMGGAAYLAAALGAAKVVSAVFRLALTNVLGAEGLGLYQMAFPVYSLLVTVTATCMSVAVSRLVAEKAASGGIGREYLLPGIVLAALPSVLLGAAVLLFSDKIAAVQGNSAVKTGYFAIIPAVIFVAAGSVFKGWFQGRFNLVPTAFSGVFSQAVKLVAGLGLAVYLKKYGTAGAVFGALTGVAISEAAGCVYLAFRYFKETKCLPKLDRKTCAKDVYKELFKTVFPIMLGSVILPISGFIDTFLVVNVLKAQGLTTEIATSEYGLMSGAVSSLVGLPVALAVAFSVAVVPAVAASGAERNLDAVISK